MIKVLAVDDSPTMHRLFKMIFSEEDYQLRLSDNGEDGLVLADEIKPDVILLDFIMPKMNGFHFCKALRSNPKLENVPVLLITSKAEDVGDKFIDKFSNIKCIAKPFQPDELIEKMNNIIKECEIDSVVESSDNIEEIVADRISSLEVNNKPSFNNSMSKQSEANNGIIQQKRINNNTAKVDTLVEEIPLAKDQASVINKIISRVEKDVLPTLRGTIERFLKFETGYMISDISGDSIDLIRFTELASSCTGEIIIFNNEKDYHFIFENGTLLSAWFGDNFVKDAFELFQDVSGLCLLEVESLTELYEQLRLSNLSDGLIKKCYQFYLMSILSNILESENMQFYFNEIDINEQFRSSLGMNVIDIDKYFTEFIEERTEINKILFDNYIIPEKQDVNLKDLTDFEKTILNLCDGKRNLNKILSFFGNNRQFVKNTIGMLILTGYINI